MAPLLNERAARAHAPTPGRPPLPVLLRIDPSFVQAQTLDGRPFIAKDAEPYTQFWLSERERQLLAQFAGRRGAREADATAGYLRMSGVADTAAERQRIAKAVRGMRAAGVLIAVSEDTSRYSEAIAPDYIAHRPFPGELAAHIIEQGGVRRDSAVLDLAGGPGDLALQLAQASDHVSLMELSRGFLKTAERRARERGLRLGTVHDSCNRLLHHDGSYQVVTVSQALHWLDDVAVCRGLCRLLQAGGSFFVVHSMMEVPDTHPLAYLLGWDSILGAKQRRPMVDEVLPLQRRLTLLFQALDTRGVDRIDPTHLAHGHQGLLPITPAGVALYRQQRPFGPGYARGFLTPRHIAVTGMKPAAFWRDLEERCAGAQAADFTGTHHWAVLHFQRGAQGVVPATLADLPVREIGFSGPDQT